jgi:hypothetical protein
MSGLRRCGIRRLRPKEQAEMSTSVMDRTVVTGDVLEIAVGDDAITALVLLAADDFVILDRCDDTTPFVLRRDELVDFKAFDPAA